MAACEHPLPEGFGCTGDVVPGVMVLVRDAVTDVPAAHGVRGIVRDQFQPTYVESLYVARWVGSLDSAGALGLRGAAERAGTYRIHLERQGYQSWDTSGVVVTRNVCHVITVDVPVRLQPEPPPN